MADQDHPAVAIPPRPLGRAGAKVSALALGGHHLGDLKTVDEAIRQLYKSTMKYDGDVAAGSTACRRTRNCRCSPLFPGEAICPN